MSERRRVYIGGPLNNQPVQPLGDHWSHFRDDEGQPIPDDVGDAEWNGNRERFYYWASQAPGGITSVHLTWINESGRVTLISAADRDALSYSVDGDAAAVRQD